MVSKKDIELVKMAFGSLLMEKAARYLHDTAIDELLKSLSAHKSAKKEENEEEEEK